MSSKKNSIQRDLFFGILVTALVFACALIMGGPFLSAGSSAAASAVSALQTPLHATTVNGTVKRSGDQVYLNDGFGKIYQLDNAEHMRPFEGRLVTVTGQLNSKSMLIHVEKIETIDA